MKIVKVDTKDELKEFIMFPYKLYQGNPYWVPPLIMDAKKMAYGETPLFKKGPYQHILVKDENRILGRITYGIDEVFNKEKGIKEAYFTLFETVNDENVVELLFQEVEKFARQKGMDSVKGPISPTNGDDFRGLLIDNFTSPPSLLESYNPPYYKELIEKMGYIPFYDFYSYIFYLDKLDLTRHRNGTKYAIERYGFFLKTPHPKEVKKDKEKIIKDVKYIMDRAVPNDWLDPIISPSEEELREIINELIPLAVPGSLIMAYSNEGEPIGFNVSLPNYNEVLKKLNGRLFPFGLLKFLYYKRKIQSAKSFIMFVIPPWHKKGVSATMYLKGLELAKKYGYKWIEGGTIGRDNLSMRNDAEKLGGKHYKTFRLYTKKIE